MPPCGPLLGLTCWCPIRKSSRYNPFEDLEIVDFIPGPGYPNFHDDVIKWKHYARYWSFMRGFHWSPVDSPHKGQWRGALMFSLICANNRDAGDLRCHRAHYDDTVIPNELQRLDWVVAPAVAVIDSNTVLACIIFTERPTCSPHMFNCS